MASPWTVARATGAPAGLLARGSRHDARPSQAGAYSARPSGCSPWEEERCASRSPLTVAGTASESDGPAHPHRVPELSPLGHRRDHRGAGRARVSARPHRRTVHYCQLRTAQLRLAEADGDVELATVRPKGCARTSQSSGRRSSRRRSDEPRVRHQIGAKQSRPRRLRSQTRWPCSASQSRAWRRTRSRPPERHRGRQRTLRRKQSFPVCGVFSSAWSLSLSPCRTVTSGHGLTTRGKHWCSWGALVMPHDRICWPQVAMAGKRDFLNETVSFTSSRTAC